MRESESAKWVVVDVDGTVSVRDATADDYQEPSIFCRVVGGSWEAVRLDRDGKVYGIVNESGLILKPPLKMNRRLPGLAGRILICTLGMVRSGEGFEEPEFLPIREDFAILVKHHVEQLPVLSEETAEASRPDSKWRIVTFGGSETIQ